MSKRSFRESDLAFPVKNYLEGQGYVVRSEVRDCDITAVRGDELIVIELKRGFTIDLLIQAVQRQQAADSVYVAIPFAGRKGERYTRRWRGTEHLLKRLSLGLILVHFSADTGEATAVEVVFHPIREPLRRRRPKLRQAILREIAGRSEDYNIAGVAGRPLLTAYREQAIFVALCLETFGPQSPSCLRTRGASPKAGAILQRNVYGWFDRPERGVYTVRPGVVAYITENWPAFAAKCRGQWPPVETGTENGPSPES
ncbi:MAG: DUF2161 family putative PD-(D/E)XK-type phosphodiesterase [Capsulimonadales bacterium]|nr:DUF2161 family putative PD-(D/E)XK-type phosphodiesterase [Capsulimonadales bacterium]